MERIILRLKGISVESKEMIIKIEEGLKNEDFAHEDEQIQALKEEREYLKQAHLAINYLHQAFVNQPKYYKQKNIICKIADFTQCPYFKALPKGCNECAFNFRNK